MRSVPHIAIKFTLAVVWFACFVAASQQGLHSPASDVGYLDSRACNVCHQEIAEQYSRSGMARSFGAVSVDSSPELRAGSFKHEPSQESFTLYVRDGKPGIKRHQIGFDGAVSNELKMPVDYWMGSGRHATSYISRTTSGELVELPVTWYAEKNGYWAMSPGYDRPDHAGFSRKITYRCLFCHSAYPDLKTEPDDSFGGTRFPDKLPGGIDCQRCHGPGQTHVDAVSRGDSPERVRAAIVNPARLSPDRQMEVCMQCHLETTSLRLPGALLRYGRGVFSYRPGEPLSDYVLYFDRSDDVGYLSPSKESRFELVSAAYRLRKSPCYLQSRGQLTCTTCHDPHQPAADDASRRRYNEACQSCHRNEVQNLVARRRHPEAQTCVSCHMIRRRPTDAIHVTVTDHLIQKKLPAGVEQAQVERHDGNTDPYRGRVALYYPDKLADPESELYTALAQVAQESNLDEGSQQLERLLARLSPRRSDFYFELGEAFRRRGSLDRALSFYEQACSRAPADWRHFYRLGTTLSTKGETNRAASAFERARRLAPRETAILEAIANLFSSQGKQEQAVSTLQTALEIDPESASLHTNLGARLLQLGDAKAAERAWREALRLRPESSTTQLNLANLLSSQGRFDEASYHYKAAIRIAPSVAEVHFSYATALAARGNVAEAEQQLREAVRNAPNHFEAHLTLGKILLARGDKKQAAQHLEKAAQSPDRRVRDSATDLLRSVQANQ